MDLKYNIETMDLVIENGDFSIETNPSEQRGGLLLYTKNTNYSQPLVGVGIGAVINSNVQTVKYFLNKWESQVTQDGGRGTWTIEDKDGGIVINTKSNYE